MGCGCSKRRTTYRVIGSKGQTVYTSTSEQVAKAVARRYPDSTIESTGPDTGKTPLNKK